MYIQECNGILHRDDRLIATEEGYRSVKTIYLGPRDLTGTQVLTTHI
jgi:hypothetical protein